MRARTAGILHGIPARHDPFIHAQLTRDIAAPRTASGQYLEPLVDFRSANADWVRGSACCAQFLVHRRQILRYPLRFYRRLYSWSIDASRDDYVEGRFLEYAWHVIWGDDEARRPDESQHACGLGHSRRCTKFEMEQRRHNEAEGDLEDEL